jgi:hypothetical protein
VEKSFVGLAIVTSGAALPNINGSEGDLSLRETRRALPVLIANKRTSPPGGTSEWAIVWFVILQSQKARSIDQYNQDGVAVFAKPLPMCHHGE